MFSIFSSNKKKKVMMIDDDQKILDMYEQVLSNNEMFEIITVTSRQEFLANIDKVDAVVSDFHMKEVTEINFTSVLELCDKKRKPLLLITGDIYPYYDYQLAKPVSAKTIRIHIEKMLVAGYVPSKKKPPTDSNFINRGFT